MRTSRLLAVILLVVSGASATAQPRTSPAPPPAKTAPARPAPPKARPPTPAAEGVKPTRAELEKLLADMDSIAATVSALRKLPIRKPIARGIMSREEVTARVLARIDEEYDANELATEARAFKRLGLLPDDADYKRLVVDLLTEQIAGFYDPRARELYIADWIDVVMQRMVVAHEILHALQDQAFDLNRFTKPNKENGDAQLARQALVEGDGVAVMVEFLFREMKQTRDPWADDTVANMFAGASLPAGGRFGEAPLFLREGLLFPYQAGLRFVAASRRTRPWSDIDAMFRAPPLSTEQILHPEKYRAGERPVRVVGKPLRALRGWRRVFTNVVGELMWSVLLREHGIDPERARRAAAGWGGDTLWALAPPKDGGDAAATLVLDLSTWDAEIDAAEAWEALADAIQSLAGADRAGPRGPTHASATGRDGRVAFVERRGARVLLAVGLPADVAERVRAEVWKRWRVHRR